MEEIMLQASWYNEIIIGASLSEPHTCRKPAVTVCIYDRPQQNQPYCVDNHFLVKATIANYNLWTAAPVNLKSLAQVLTVT